MCLSSSYIIYIYVCIYPSVYTRSIFYLRIVYYLFSSYIISISMYVSIHLSILDLSSVFVSYIIYFLSIFYLSVYINLSIYLSIYLSIIAVVDVVFISGVVAVAVTLDLDGLVCRHERACQTMSQVDAPTLFPTLLSRGTLIPPGPDPTPAPCSYLVVQKYD